MKNHLIITIGNRELTLNPGMDNNDDKKIFANFTEKMVSTLIENINQIVKNPYSVDQTIKEVMNKYKETYKGLACRPGGKLIYDNLKYLLKQKITPDKYIGFPIIEKAFDFLDCHLDDDLRCIDSLVLVVTDQNENTPTRYRNNDTLYFGEIAKTLLPKKLKKLGITLNCNIDTIKIKSSAGDYDLMYEFWRGQLKSKKFRKMEKDDNIYLLSKGGMPQVYQSLLTTMIMYFKSSVFHLSVSEQDSQARSSNFPALIWQDINKSMAQKYLENIDFSGLYNFMKMEGLVNSNSFKITEIAASKLQFDLKKAKKQALEFGNVLDKKTGLTDIKARDLSKKIIKEIKSLQDENKDGFLARTQELAMSAMLKAKHGQYVDFLLRIFRITESLYRKITEDALDIPTDKDPEEKFKPFENKIKAYNALKDYLGTKKIEGTPLKWSEPNVRVLSEVCSFILEMTTPDEKTISSIKFAKALEGLTQLRNKSIAAHGYEGVSRDIIIKKLHENGYTNLENTGGTNFTGDLIDQLFIDMEKYLDINLTNNIYHEIRNYILDDIS